MENWDDIDREAEGFGWELEPKQITFEQVDYIEQLLSRSNYDHDHREQIEKGLNGLTYMEASYLIEDLKENQLDPITSGFNYGMTEVKDKLNKEK